MIPDNTPSPSQWIKASKSAGDNACVEMRCSNNAVEVRDTKQEESGPILALHRNAYAVWLKQAKRGDLDFLLS